jgi:hypothetical protein
MSCRVLKSYLYLYTSQKSAQGFAANLLKREEGSTQIVKKQFEVGKDLLKKLNIFGQECM